MEGGQHAYSGARQRRTVASPAQAGADEEYRDALARVALITPKRPKHKAKGAADARLHRLESFENLPAYLQDNEYIFGSYRPEATPWAALRSAFSLHNESGNIWTHFLGFFLFLGLALYFASHPPTPLVVTADHVMADLQVLGHSLSEGVHALEHRLSDGVHLLSDGVHRLSDGVHAFEDRLHHLQDDLAGGLHSLQDSLHRVEARLQHRAAGLGSSVAGWRAATAQFLRTQREPIVAWPSPRWPVYVYFAGACVCLLTSGVCHLLGCCKKHITELVWRFDYAGIAVLIVASFVPAMYYAFLCEPFWRNFYLLSTLTLGCCVVGMSLPSRFQSRHFRALRAVVFTLLGAWGIVPVSHQLIMHGHVWAIRRAFQLDLLMGAVYVGGAVIYACRVPERWYPGRFDIIGHSHQLWHAAVVLAAFVHYCAMLVLLQWRDAAGGCAAPHLLHGPVHELLAQPGTPLLAGQAAGAQLGRLAAAAARRL